MLRRSVLALSLLVGAGCFDPLVPADTAIACSGDGDCPDGLICAGFLERCVAASGGDRVAPGVVSSTLSARRLGGDGVLVVTLTPDEPTLDGSVLQVADRTVVLVADPDLSDPSAAGRTLTASLGVGDLGDGAYAVSAVLVDASGNVGVAVLGSIEVDTRPPAIEDGSVDLVVTQPSGTAPVDEPPLAPGGRVDLAFRLDDLNATVERVALVSDDDGAADIVLGLLDQTSNAWSFGATLDVATTTGPHRLIVTAVDDVGNRVGIEVDTIDVVGAIESACVAVDAGGTPVCTDADGDGFFAPGEGCAPGQASDCDDTRAAVHPGAVEVAGDAIDDDCDGDAPSYDDAETAGLALFVRPGAPLDAPATRAAPSGDLVGVVARLPAGGVAYVQRGTFALGAASIVPGGSIVGGLDDAWRPSGERTLLQSDIGLDFAPLGDGPPALLRGVTVRGAWCRAADGHDGGLEVVDVEVVVDGRSGCNQWTGLFGPRLRVTDSVVDLRQSGAPMCAPSAARTSASSTAASRWRPSTFVGQAVLDGGDRAQPRRGVGAMAPRRSILDGAVMSSQIVLEAGDNVGFFGSAALVVVRRHRHPQRRHRQHRHRCRRRGCAHAARPRRRQRHHRPRQRRRRPAHRRPRDPDSARLRQRHRRRGHHLRAALGTQRPHLPAAGILCALRSPR
jgi:hypothetical protein